MLALSLINRSIRLPHGHNSDRNIYNKLVSRHDSIRMFSFTDILKSMEKKKPVNAPNNNNNNNNNNSNNNSSNNSNTFSTPANKNADLRDKNFKRPVGNHSGNIGVTSNSSNSNSANFNNPNNPNYVGNRNNSNINSNINSNANNNSNVSSNSNSNNQAPKQKIDLTTLRLWGSELVNQKSPSGQTSRPSNNMSSGLSSSSMRKEPSLYLKEMMAKYDQPSANDDSKAKQSETVVKSANTESVKSKFQITEHYNSGSEKLGGDNLHQILHRKAGMGGSSRGSQGYKGSTTTGNDASQEVVQSIVSSMKTTSPNRPQQQQQQQQYQSQPQKQQQQQQQPHQEKTLSEGERRYKDHIENLRLKALESSARSDYRDDSHKQRRYSNQGHDSYIKNNTEMSLEEMRASLRGSFQKSSQQPDAEHGSPQQNKNAHNKRDKHTPVVKTISIPSDQLSIRRLAELLSMKLPLLKEKIEAIGESLPVSGYEDHLLDADTAELLIMEMGLNVNRLKNSGLTTAAERKSLHDPSLLVPRSPIVCIMGHVDHGKTTLLDTLRTANVAASEAGGITQRLSAFIVQMAGKRVVFLDTPGHAAFASMRVNGASATDVAVLVVAIEDGLQPQSIEAIEAAKKAGCSIIVALNKVDRISPTELPKLRSKVLSQLIQHDVVVEEMGGTVQVVEISGKTGLGVDKLIEALSMEADILNLKSVENVNVDAIVMDACFEKGRGIVTDIVVKDGTLKVGDVVVVGLVSGKVKSLIDSSGKTVKSVGPATPVRVIGMRELPLAGTEFMSVDSEDAAQGILLKRKRIHDLKLQRDQSMKAGSAEGGASEGNQVNLVLKADSPGTLEALRLVVENKISQVSNVKVAIVEGNVGDVTKSDIEIAHVANKAHILGFNIKISDSETKNFAEMKDIKFTRNNVIYRLEEELVTIMRQTLPKHKVAIKEGSATLLKTFPLTVGKSSDKSEAIVAGLKVNEGIIRTSGQHEYVYSIVRNGNVVAQDIKAKTLRRLKDEVHEVAQGNECGLILESFKDLLPSDEVICNRIEWQFGNLEYH